MTFDANRHTELSAFLTFLVSLVDPGRKHNKIRVDTNEDGSYALSAMAQRLIEANLRRRHRFLYSQRRSMKQAMTDGEVDEPKESRRLDSARPMGENIAKRALGLSDHEIESRAKRAKLEDQPSHTSSSKPTSMEGTIEIPRQSQPSTSALSSTSSTVIYPRPPNIIDGQGMFNCPCCYQTLPVSSAKGRHWR